MTTTNTPAPAAAAAAASLPVRRLALLGALIGAFETVHPLADQWCQNSRDAACKGLHGPQRVHWDGKPAKGSGRPLEPTVAASTLGRIAAARHVASYTATQLTATQLVTRSLGVRIPGKALLAGVAVNAATHYVIDRRRPLLRAARKLRKGKYLERCTVVRRIDPTTGELVVDESGPGTALMELDQAAHRALGLAAAAVTTWLATRTR